MVGQGQSGTAQSDAQSEIQKLQQELAQAQQELREAQSKSSKGEKNISSIWM